MATRQVRIELKAPTWESVVVIDGVAQQMIERVTLNAGAKEPMPRLELTRIVTHEEARARGEYGMLDMDVPRIVDTLSGGEYDIEIEGIAEVVELLADEARKAAAEQRIALSSFMIRESGDPAVITLGELLRDAKRYRALRWGTDQNEVTVKRYAANGVDVDTAVAGGLDVWADELREKIGRMRGDGVS